MKKLALFIATLTLSPLAFTQDRYVLKFVNLEKGATTYSLCANHDLTKNFVDLASKPCPDKNWITVPKDMAEDILDNMAARGMDTVFSVTINNNKVSRFSVVKDGHESIHETNKKLQKSK